MPSFPVAADQVVRGTVVAGRRLFFALQFRDNALGEHFTELHAPLVERVNVPNRALGKNNVLVKSHKLA